MLSCNKKYRKKSFKLNVKAKDITITIISIILIIILKFLHFISNVCYFNSFDMVQIKALFIHSSAKLLLVTFNDKLIIDEHTSSLVRTLFYSNYAFLKIRVSFPINIFENFYNSIVYTHLLYTLSMWVHVTNFFIYAKKKKDCA